jgi:AraC family transcriptional regulator
MRAESHTVAARRERSKIAGVGRVLGWNGGSLWIGHSAMHSHHALQLSIALAGPFELKSGRTGAWSRHTAALVRPDAQHEFNGCGTTIAQVFVEPETSYGRALLAMHPDGDVVPLALGAAQRCVDVLARQFQARASNAALISSAQACVATLAGLERETPPIDARIARVLQELRARFAQPVSLAEAARWAHLSPSRFRHLFADQVGTSFRAYLLWLRINAAVEHAMAGATWTEAAHFAGFADSSHLSRTFRRMFGFVPVMLVRE